MRIISGNFKGKKILHPKDNLTRPLKDLTKESIFNIINHSSKFKINLNNSKILDLFSGVGSFGGRSRSGSSSSPCPPRRPWLMFTGPMIMFTTGIDDPPYAGGAELP